MTPRWIAATATALALLPASAAWATGGQAVSDYAARWSLQVPAGAALARLPLPAEVLTRLQTSDARDLRIFNAAGQPVPLAVDRDGPAAAPARQAPPVELAAMPLMGNASQPPGEQGTLRVRIEGARAISIEQTGDAPTQAARPIGALIDTRAVQAPLSAIELVAQMPEAETVTFRLHASEDLQQWRALGAATAYRQGDFAAPARLRLQGERLRNQFLRVTWHDAGMRADLPVQIQAVRLTPQAEAAPAPRPAVALALPPQERVVRDGGLEFALPFATPLAALDIQTGRRNFVQPVRVLARERAEQPWTPVARHVVYAFDAPEGARTSPPAELAASRHWRQWRIEPEPRAAAIELDTVTLRALFAPVQVVFATSGEGPFTLAAGRADAPAAALPLATLMPGYQSGAQQRLPAATLGASSDTRLAVNPVAPPAVTAQPVREGPNQRQWLLWGVLVGGALALAAMAWALARQLNRGGHPPGQSGES
ncbi:MAG: DUF3999 family protein [Pseudomonadota bacterium]|nr:DUF3999 family protein [Pseudomonadota bacterium]